MKAEDELVMETFYHNSGGCYSCLYQSGQRYYLDSWETMDWHPFPNEWYNEGVLVTEQEQVIISNYSMR